MANRVVPFQPWHYIEATKGLLPWEDQATIAAAYGAHPCWSGFVDEALAGCAGVCLIHRGVGEAWAVLTDVGRAHPQFTHRAVLGGLRRVIREHALHRVQAHVIREFHAGRIWIERLGFRREGLMRQYGPDRQDMIRYAWVQERTR